MLFCTQTVAIVIGHLAAVLVAHTMAIETGLSRPGILKLEAPLVCMMVFYTAFGPLAPCHTGHIVTQSRPFAL